MARISARERAFGDSMWERVLETGMSQVYLHDGRLENYRNNMDEEGLLLVNHEPCEIRPAKDSGIFLEVNPATDDFKVKYGRPDNEDMYKHQAISVKTNHNLCPLCMDLLDYYCRYQQHLDLVSSKDVDEEHSQEDKMLNNVIHHHCLASLAIFADVHKCFICTILMKAAGKKFQAMFENQEQFFGWRVECCFGRDKIAQKIEKFFFVVVDPKRPKKPLVNYAPICAIHLWPKSSYHHNFEIESSLSNDGQTRMKELAKRWLRRCISNESNEHDICNGFVEEFFPTRVLDVEEVRSTGSLRLICAHPGGDEGRAKTKYCTLSYNWGPDGAKNNPILTENNLAFRCQQGVQLKELPQTFQDAFEVCHWFDIRYLWIDSLCIIQDSAADWHQEANLMSKTYRNAWLNISADRGIDPHVSLFQDTPILDRSWPEFGSTSKDSNWYITPQADHFISQIHEAPSFSRAWIHRERQLSRRILHFTAQGIAWECCETNRSSYASESFPGGVPFKYFLSADNKYQTGRYQTALIPNDEETYASWNDVCMVLSSKEITKEADRPMILSAIAEDFSRLLPADQYVAGLWRSTMPHSLLWSVQGIESTSKIAAPQGGPTWSWFSAGKRVSLRHRARIKSLAVLATILDVSTPLATPVLPAEHNPFGPIQSGRLKIRGFLREIRLELQASRRDWKVYVREKEVHHEGIAQTREQKSSRSWRKRLLGRTSKRSTKVKREHDPWRFLGNSFDAELGDLLDLSLDYRGVPVPLDCFALFITIDYISHIYEVGQKLDCLLLEKVEGKQDAFNRIGTLTVETEMALKLRYWVDQSHPYDGFEKASFEDVEVSPLQFLTYEQETYKEKQESRAAEGKEEEEEKRLEGKEALYRFDRDIEESFPWLTKLEEQTIILE